MPVAKQILIFITQIFFCAFCLAQREKIDSLKNLLRTDNKEDTIRANRLLHLSDSYIYDEPDSGIYYANSALQLSKKLRYVEGEARTYYILGQAYWVLGNYAQSMQYNLQALNVYQQIKRPIGVSTIKYCIADIYTEVGDYRQALQYYFDARKMDEENPDDLRLLFPWISMDSRLMVSDLAIAEAYLTGNMLDSALFFAKRGFAKDHELRQDWTYPALVLGNVYFKRNQLDSALYCYRSTFKQTAQNNRIDIHNGIAAIFRERNHSDSCRYYAKMAWDTAQLIRYRKGALQSCELLAWAYEKINPVETIRYYKISTAIKDSLYDREKLSRVNFLVFSEKLKEQELQAAKAKYQNWLKTYALLAVVGFFLLVALFLWRSNRHRQKAYALLEKQARNELQIQKLESERTKAELEQQSTELEMQALRAQMNPHFIFNSLSSINLFILENNKLQASQYLSKFSRLIRLILQNSQEAFIPLEKELEALELFLELESLRFENKFEYKIILGKNIELSEIKVPPLIIQPYVENAIWHGLMHKMEKGHLEIEIYLEGEILICKISDDGIGRMKAGELKSKSALTYKSMGMRITEDRIKILQRQKQEGTFVLINDLTLADGSPGGTEVIIKIPAFYD